MLKNNKELKDRDISIWLDGFDDIFSDFDYRKYNERALSDDFLTEVKKVIREQRDYVNQMLLLLPENRRNSEQESIIAKRLHTYFKKTHLQLVINVKQTRKKALLLFILGMLLLVAAGYISYLMPEQLGKHLLIILFEPAGWFFMWTGFDLFMNIEGRRQQEIDFYDKMAKAKISFRSIPLNNIS